MYKGVGTLRAAFGFSPQSTRSSTEFFSLCRLSSRRTEGEESREHKVGCNVDVHEILRRDAPLDDKRWKRKKKTL